MNGLFITSTGTEIGKTFVTACLCHQLIEAGKPVDAIKPIISGINGADMTGTDTAVIAESLRLPLDAATIDQLSPFRYKAPLAPSMAAALEGKTLDYDALITLCKGRLSASPFTLIEGVGGSFVPLTHNRLVADWISDINLASVLVAGSYLGTISHIIATAEAMKTRKLPITAIVISETAGAGHPDLLKTQEQIENWTDIPVVTVPRIKGTEGWKQAPDLLAACLPQ
ncbi:dethiobiotin synthase [Kordiimonas pumila]|uniref:ATP-dependent dethiobiotin synthetase BioD n=1 Tax=Kordiimonas pumila TaxID=2161677 RepID=A0ABV7D0R4_9PROT|nr:dethiobiotin synthase [Kordiimonas pumila]